MTQGDPGEAVAAAIIQTEEEFRTEVTVQPRLSKIHQHWMRLKQTLGWRGLGWPVVPGKDTAFGAEVRPEHSFLYPSLKTGGVG